MAKLSGFSPADNIRSLVVLLAAALAGSVAFAGLQRRARWSWTQYLLPWVGAATGFAASVDGGSVLAILLTSIVGLGVGALIATGQIPRPRSSDLAAHTAHTMIAWTFLAPACASWLGSPTALALILMALSIFVGASLAGTNDSGPTSLGAALLVAPLAFIQSQSRLFGITSALVCYLLPFLAASLMRRSRSVVALMRGAVQVLLPIALIVLTAGTFLREPYVGDLFEDGHGLLPASEYMSGKLPYVDIVPGHGLVTDGLMQLASIRLFGDSYAGLRKGERAFGLFFWPLVYLMGFAATRQPTLAFGTALLLLALFPQFSFLRVLFSLVTLSVTFSAIHRPSIWLWSLVGVMTVAGFLFAVEFGAYTAVATCVAVLVSRRDRRRNGMAYLGGVFAASMAVAVTFATLGILSGFINVTFRLPGLLDVYAGSMPQPPMRTEASPFHIVAGPPAMEATLFYLLLLGALSVVGVAASRARGLGEFGRPLAPIAAWYIAASLSVVARSHVSAPLFLAPLGLVLAYRWLTGSLQTESRRVLLVCVGILGLVVFRPFDICRGFALRLQGLEIPPAYRPLTEPLRAGGVLFRDSDRHAVELMRRAMADENLKPGETLFDFANLPALYYLFDRRCPIRYYEVPYFQNLSRQDEVIERLERNTEVRLAILPASGSFANAIDGIPNELRAPKVYEYLRRNFRPRLADQDLQVWVRDKSR